MTNPVSIHRALSRVLTAALLGQALVALTPAVAGPTLIPAGASWKYVDDGSDQATGWRSPFFDDTSWASGAAELGYGDGDEATVVSYGPNASNKYVTTYFRRAFTVSDTAGISDLSLRLLCDDGAVVYLNGAEVLRRNLPGGTIGYRTYASSALGSPAESTFVHSIISSSALLAGDNLLAVEVHQANATSSDISFNLELIVADGASVTRGPYLQAGTPNSLTVRWRTDLVTDSRVRYGTDPLNLSLTADDFAQTTEHQVTLTGLAANTRYYYSVGSTATTLAAGDDFIFYTPPDPGTAQPIRVWVLGDSGTADSNAAAVRNAYYQFTGSRYTDLLLMLGDNAYNTGTDTEYQAAVFNMYPSMLRQTVLWPTLGNHDTAGSTNPSADLPYFNMFTLPTDGRAGGMASGTEKYYSFEFGNVHFVCLDSMTSDRLPTSAMWTWLRSDLAANTKSWLIAFWHHPPYSKGSHNSDTETALIQMRENALPILEDHGVDLVLCGHSHSYERSFLIDSHYGSSSQFTPANVKSSTSGRDSLAYQKPSNGPAPHQGAVYAVAGSSGKISGGTLNHPAMFVSLNVLGSMVLDLDGDRLDAKFLSGSGVVQDYFTIVKGASANELPDVAITAPAQNASYFAPASIEIAASASDADGSITGVEFFANSNSIGVDTSAPYTFTWVTSAIGTYALTAVATDNLGATTESAPISVTVLAPVTVPSSPTGLRGSAVASGQINLNWTDTASNEDGFVLERAVTVGSYSEVARLAANTTEYSDTSVQANATYTYRVAAYNAGGLSSYSATLTISTLAAPGGLSANVVSKNQVDLMWSDLSEGETGFTIERTSGGGKNRTIEGLGSVGPGQTRFTDSGVTPNTSYTYRVQAFNADGVSDYSNTANARTKAK